MFCFDFYSVVSSRLNKLTCFLASQIVNRWNKNGSLHPQLAAPALFPAATQRYVLPAWWSEGLSQASAGSQHLPPPTRILASHSSKVQSEHRGIRRKHKQSPDCPGLGGSEPPPLFPPPTPRRPHLQEPKNGSGSMVFCKQAAVFASDEFLQMLKGTAAALQSARVHAFLPH